jgi:hypothetical protein
MTVSAVHHHLKDFLQWSLIVLIVHLHESSCCLLSNEFFFLLVLVPQGSTPAQQPTQIDIDVTLVVVSALTELMLSQFSPVSSVRVRMQKIFVLFNLFLVFFQSFGDCNFKPIFILIKILNLSKELNYFRLVQVLWRCFVPITLDFVRNSSCL